MEVTREIYWNVGHGVVWPMYLLTFIAAAICVFGFYRRLSVYRQGKPLNRIDNFAGRVALGLKEVLLQSRVVWVKGAGTAHGLFFWAFLVLLVGTGLIFVQADLTAPLFGYRFLTGAFYKLFSLVLDVAGMAALLMMAGLFVRRYLVRPEGLVSGRDDLIMHALLFAILLSGFLVEGVRMAATELHSQPELAYFSPFGLLAAKAFSHLDASALRAWHQGLWWGHLLIVLGFIASIPFTRFRHVFTTPANYVFADRAAKGSLATLDLEDEEAESFGAARIGDLTWKDIYDSDACTQCKRCQDRCPAHATEKPLSPMEAISRIGEIANTAPDASLVEAIGQDAIWSCTTCRACQEICPAAIEHVNKVVELRRNLVLMEGTFPGEEVLAAVDNTEVNGNPLGLAFSSRGDWAQGTSAKVLAEDADVDILYFVGCYASFDRRNIEVARSFLKICEAAGVKVGILGKEEKCCGEPVRKMGNEYLYQATAAENIETIKGYGVKKVVTSCPHCFNTLSKDYRDLGFDIETEHYTVFLHRLVEQGRLNLRAEAFDCTYHDSCYLGRYNDIFEQPRSLVKSAGGTISEMSRSGLESFCCGAGGGRILAEEKLGSRISEKRASMAAETGAGVLVANCPFCLTMFEDGIKGAELEGRLATKDIAEVLAERIGG